MFTQVRWVSNTVVLKGGLILVLLTLYITCCANAPREFDPEVAGPQMIVEPETIRLGIAKVMETEIVFRGKGFQPGDSVFVSLLEVRKDDQLVDIPIADGDVDQDGYFRAKVGKLAKISELLRVKLGEDEKMENIIIVSQPPIAHKVYKARAVSMESDLKAECTVVVKGPSLIDRFKDWMGGILGKIVRE